MGESLSGRGLVHDLLRIDPASFNRRDAPRWVKQTIGACPWVVVRRAPAPAGMIAVGVRGKTRSDRWGGFLQMDFISEILRPAELRSRRHPATRVNRTPAMRVLQQVIARWQELTLPWGPTGSVGFELASGCRVTSEASDLDVAIRAPVRIPVDRARALWRRVSGLPTRVDVRIETLECGFSLEEYACRPSGKILLRYPDGVRFGDDPWSRHSQRSLAIS